MKRRLFALTIAALVAGTASAPAIDLGFGFLKRRQEKKEAKSETAVEKEQIATLKSDHDESRRKAAAAALRSTEPKPNFDAVAALSEAVLQDPSAEVRATAAESLAGFRVVYQAAVTALEKAEADDPDATVRASAKAALGQYTLSGYRPSSPKVASQSAEPPLARPAVKTTPTVVTVAKPTMPVVPPFQPITQGAVGSTSYKQSAEPPLAKPITSPEPKQPPSAVPASMPLVPQRMPSVTEPTESESPKIDLPASTLPRIDLSSPLPLPTVPTLPTLPQRTAVPTVQPPK